MTDNNTFAPRGFKTRAKTPRKPLTPEDLFSDLPRRPNGVPALWSHQADQLRTYHSRYKDSANVALELPTGSGKTLVGLLIAEWRRQALEQRVVYACPTVQLARQANAAAQNEGIPTVLLTGSNLEWNPRDKLLYSSGDAIAVTTYKHVFNSRPKFADAGTLIFDDAHAAENYVAESWALKIPAAGQTYAPLLDVLRPSLPGDLVSRLAGSVALPDQPDIDVRLLPVSVVNKHKVEIEATLLATLPDGDKWNFSRLRSNLASCLFYVDGRGMYLRPMIPATFDHPAFVDPSQRVYLSATLGRSGELERAFGISSVERVPVPKQWDRTGSGRRFFVFPDLVNHDISAPAYDGYFGADIMKRSNKHLVLTTNQKDADKLAIALSLKESHTFQVKDPEGFSKFLQADSGTLLAPNRYDGMDLADDTCRMMLMLGLPAFSHMQDSFFDLRLRAKEVLGERVQTRIVQGLGRCTRGPKDYAVVVVEGEDLVHYLSRKENVGSLPVELQAEISFGMTTSDVSREHLLQLVDSALHQDEAWQTQAEPEIADLRATAQRLESPAIVNLGETAGREVKAWRAAWAQDWQEAGRLAIDVYEHLIDPGLRSYRALWAYLAYSWISLSKPGGSSETMRKATEMLAQANRATQGTTWLKELQTFTTDGLHLDDIDESALDGIIAYKDGPAASASKYDTTSSQMNAAFAQSDSVEYEAALQTLGKLLGAKESYKPSFKGRTDCVWMWDELWMTIEAKSEQHSDGLLSMEYIRQTNTQLDSLAADRKEKAVPNGSFSVVVSPRLVVDPHAVPIAREWVHLVSTAEVLRLGLDVDRAWKAIRSISTSDSDHRTAIARVFWEHGALPSQVKERMTRNPVR